MKRVSRLILATILAGLASLAFGADTAIDRANREADKGNAQAAFTILSPLAENGDADAQYALAKIQLREQWRDRNPVEGKMWLTKAAEQGHGAAQFSLALYYDTEEKNYPEARTWYRKAAEQHADEPVGRAAAENLGAMYAIGQGVTRDYVEAARWYRRSAERGGKKGQYALGMFHLEGLVGHKDFNEAVKWLGASAKQGFQPAQYTLVLVFAEGFDTTADAAEAAYWYTGKRGLSDGEATYQVGTFYARGFSVWRDEQRVIAWLLRRRGTASATAEPYLKQLYGESWGDETQAVRWYRISAEAGYVGAQVNLARIYWNTESQYWNCAEAARWTRLAADKGDATAMVNMGMLYAQGPKERVTRAIGVELEETDSGVRVKRVIDGSPADVAGIRPREFIVGFNGKDVQKLSMREIAELVRSAKGEMTIGLRADNDATPRMVNLSSREVRTKCPGAEIAGLRQDLVQSVAWFEKASNLGDPTGLFYLAQAYRKGNGVAQDNRKAFDLYKKGADNGDWEAAQAISHMYNSGEAGEQNKDLADEWFRKAVDLKHKSLGR